MIYCSTVRQTLFSIKRNLKNKVKVFLPVLFLALFLFPVNVNAQSSSLTIDFSPFKCLFELTSTNCSPSDDETAIGRGEASGVIYGQTNEFSETGVSAITMRIGLQADLAKEKSEKKYFFGRVADRRSDSFFLRFKYLVPGTTTPLNYFIDVPYQEDNVQIQTGWIPSSVSVSTINTNTANGSAQTKIAFYKVGPSGYEVVTQQVLLAKATLDSGIELPYGANVEAELWYCGGAKEDTEPSSLEKEASATAFLALQSNPNISGDERNRLMAIVELGRNPVDGRYAPREEGRVEYFTKSGEYKDYLNRINGTTSTGIAYSEDRCSGSGGVGAAYKIGTTRKFTLPANKAAAEASSQENLESGITASSYLGSTLPLCSITPFGDGSVMGCIAQILYGGVFRPVAFFAQVMGKLFDFFIGYSLSDESYRHDFVQTGWQLVRDISNIFFIIIMIYSGLAAVFSTSNVSYKKVIPTLIINALIINFSLFATRLVIDMSNITARIFYNQMVVKVDGQVAENTTGFKPISEAIVSSFNPQKIFEGKVLESEAVTEGTKQNESDPTTFNGQSDPSLANGGFKRYSKEYASYFALVTLVAIAISFGVAIMFWKTAFLFIGRVIGLYVAMIFSPFAFLSRGGVPLVSRLPALNFGSWWKDLSQYALLAPIFVFFLYIINSFLNVEFFTKVGLEQNGQGFFGSVMYVMIPMLIIYGLVTRGVKIAESLAGEYGKMAQSFANKATGFVGGAAVGVTSLGASRLIGGGADRLDRSRFGVGIRNMAARSGLQGMLGKRLEKRLEKLKNNSFDARQTTVGRQLSTSMGLNLDQQGLNALSGSGLGLGVNQREGGFNADVKRRQDEQEKKQKLLEEKMSDDQIKAYNEKQQNKRADRIEKLIEKAMIATHGKDNVSDWKKNNKQRYDTEKNNALQNPQLQTQISNIPPAKEMRSVAEMNKDRRKQFADNLKKSGLDGILGGVPVLGKIIGTTIGAALGANTRKTADKKAAKKIEESSKVEKELADIETTLKKGFQDLIALDLFQSSPSFTTNITGQEQQDIVKFGAIQSGTNKGKGMYDILTDNEKKRIDTELKQKKDAMSQGTDDEKKKAKEEYEEYEDLIKARESNKFDLKDLRGKLKIAKENWVNSPADQSMRDLFREKLKEVKIAEKHQDKWRDLNNYIKTRRDKLKGEEKK